MSAEKSVLVTGATGFIGRATVSALTEAGWTVTGGSRQGGEKTAPDIVYIDLADPATVLALEKKSRFDAIVHLGARVSLSDTSEAEMFAPNILSTGCLAYLANLWDAHMLYSSTAIVHGVRSVKIHADSSLCTDTAYAKSKWLGEQLLAASNATHCVLRIAGVFGSDGPAHLGLNRAIEGAIKGESPVKIGDGRALRNYIYVKDVARAIVHALQERLSGTHLLAGHESVSLSEMLRQVCDAFLPGSRPVLKDGPQATDQLVTPSSSLPVTRGFRQALIDIRDGCRP
jgi:nucleoside-diphosphate-sugar epimerase